MEPLSAGLNRVDCSPIRASMVKMSHQAPVMIPAAPASMAASSSAFDPMTTRRLAKRSASHPAGAANRMNGSV